MNPVVLISTQARKQRALLSELSASSPTNETCDNLDESAQEETGVPLKKADIESRLVLFRLI